MLLRMRMCVRGYMSAWVCVGVCMKMCVNECVPFFGSLLVSSVVELSIKLSQSGLSYSLVIFIVTATLHGVFIAVCLLVFVEGCFSAGLP